MSVDDVTLGQVLNAVDTGNRNILEQLRRQDKVLQQLAGNQMVMIDLLTGHSGRLDRLEKRAEALENNVGI